MRMAWKNIFPRPGGRRRAIPALSIFATTGLAGHFLMVVSMGATPPGLTDTPELRAWTSAAGWTLLLAGIAAGMNIADWKGADARDWFMQAACVMMAKTGALVMATSTPGSGKGTRREESTCWPGQPL